MTEEKAETAPAPAEAPKKSEEKAASPKKEAKKNEVKTGGAQ